MWPVKSDGRRVARFNVEMADMRLYGFGLSCKPDGLHRIHMPAKGGKPVVTMAPDARVKLTQAAIAAYEEMKTVE